MTVMAPKFVRATSLARFRPIAGLWFVCDEKSIGMCLAQLTSLIAARGCADNVCAEDTRGCLVVLAAEGGRVVSRVAERNCGRAAGCEEGFRPCGTSSSFQGDEIAKIESFLDVFHDCELWWKLHEGA